MLQKEVRGKKVQTMAMMMLMTSYRRVRKVGELTNQQFMVPGSNKRFSTLIHGRKTILKSSGPAQFQFSVAPTKILLSK